MTDKQRWKLIFLVLPLAGRAEASVSISGYGLYWNAPAMRYFTFQTILVSHS